MTRQVFLELGSFDGRLPADRGDVLKSAFGLSISNKEDELADDAQVMTDALGYIHVEGFSDWLERKDLFAVFRTFALQTDVPGAIEAQDSRRLLKELGIAVSGANLSIALHETVGEDTGLLTFGEFLPVWDKVKALLGLGRMAKQSESGAGNAKEAASAEGQAGIQKSKSNLV